MDSTPPNGNKKNKTQEMNEKTMIVYEVLYVELSLHCCVR